ncbi:MAG: hypothetical protein HY644_06480 [Acidobacteria bacterium]|nr:hypothetical protein [Acidobacteriota bacterium]
MEQLGILVTTVTHRAHIIGLALAAAKSRRKVFLFLTDEGVLLLNNPLFLALREDKNIQLSVCLHSAELHGLKERQAGVAYGGQFLNAQIAHECRRFLVF